MTFKNSLKNRDLRVLERCYMKANVQNIFLYGGKEGTTKYASTF